jgi:phenylalanyl-tRNA synthetase beta chain
MNQVYPRTNGMDADGVPENGYNLGFVFADATSKTNYYVAKKYLENLLENLGVKYEIKPFEAAKDATNAYYEPKRSATIYAGDEAIGYLGEIKNKVLREFKLASGTAAFELNLKAILEKAEGATHKDFRVSQYPSVSRDVTLTVPLETEYIKLEKQIRGLFELRNYIYKVYCTSIYQADGAKTKNVSFHLDFANPNKTLEKDEINAIMTEVESIK